MTRRNFDPIELPDDVDPSFGHGPPPLASNLHRPDPSASGVGFTPPETVDVDPEAIELQTSRTRRRPGRAGLGLKLFHHTITLFNVLLIAALGYWAYQIVVRSGVLTKEVRLEHDARLDAYLVDAQVARLGFAVEVSRVFNERPPSSLEQLVEAGLLIPSDLSYPSGVAGYDYTHDQQAFHLQARPLELEPPAAPPAEPADAVADSTDPVPSHAESAAPDEREAGP